MTQQLRDAMRVYYEHCAAQCKGHTWDKQADLKKISLAFPKTVAHWEACAGTFLVMWKGGVQTIHNKKNYWQEAVLTRTTNSVCRQYRGMTGKKLSRSEVVTR
jgi:hypothetical protein